MKKIKLSSLAPLGINVKKELRWVIIGIVASALFSLIFIWRWRREYRYSLQCYEYSLAHNTVFEEKMSSFADLTGGVFAGFWIVIVAMAVMAVLHLRMHYAQSKSIYLLRRLPDHKDLIWRTIGMPLLGTVLTFVTAAVLLIIYYLVYRYLTPAVLLSM